MSEASPAKLSAASAAAAPAQQTQQQHGKGAAPVSVSEIAAAAVQATQALAAGRGAVAALGLASARPAAAASQLTADDNAAVATPSDQVLYVIVGPVTSPNSSALGAAASAGGAVDFASLAEDCPVSGVASAVDVAIISSDRLLTVRRPAHASAGGAAATEYVVTIEPLDVSLDDVAALSAAAAAAAGASPTSPQGAPANAAGAPLTAAQVKAQRQRDAVMTPFKFGLHDPVSRVFPTPFRAPRQLLRHVPAASAPSNSDDEARLADAAAELASDELPCAATEDPLSSGDVLLYVTRFRRPDAAPTGAATPSARQGGGSTDDSVPLGQDRAVLRYSSNAFGTYDRRNPHGYAICAAHTPTKVSCSLRCCCIVR